MWMFYSRSTNRKINHLHERALRLTYDDYELTFEELLEKDVSFTIHIRIFRRYVLNYIKYTRTCHKLFSAICLHETSVLISYT